MDYQSAAIKEIRKVWAHKWIALTITIVLCLAGWTYIYFIPDRYQSSARVYIDTQSMLGPLLRGLAIDSNERQRSVAQMAKTTLLSRPNLEQVIRENDMDIKARTPEEYEKLLKGVMKRVDVRGEGRNQENIYVISYYDEKPLIAKKVVSSLLSIFMENALGTTRTDTGLSEKFLDEQIAKYQAKLEAAENRLKEFKRKNIGMMPSESGGYLNRLQAAQEQLAQADLDLLEAQKRYTELKKQIASVKSDDVSSEEKSAIDARINTLEKKLDELRLQYTEQHPDIQTIKNTIQSLKQQKEGESIDAGAASAENDKGTITSSPAYQELKVALGQAAAEVSALTARKKEYESRVDKLHNMLETVPEVEAELVKLNRDYSITKQNYDSLVSRKESASISRAAESSSDMLQFRIIDPPVVPVIPLDIKKAYLFSVMFLIAIGGGAAASWLLSNLRNAFIDANELREAYALPVLGAVSEALTEPQIVKRRIGAAVFTVIFGCLIAVYGMVIALQTGVIELFR